MIAQSQTLQTIDETLDLPLQLVDEARQAFRDKLEDLVTDALEAPTDHDDHVDTLLEMLIKINTKRPQPSYEAARQALEASRQESLIHRCQLLAQDIVDVAGKLSIKLAVADDSCPAKTTRHPRLTAKKRQEITGELPDLLANNQPQGLAKAQIARHFNISINQTKRLLQSPELLDRVTRIGHASESRYVVKKAGQQPSEGSD